MNYEEALDALIKRATAEHKELLKQFIHVKPWTEESAKLSRKLQLMYKRHNKEFSELRAKYHLPPPKVVDSIFKKGENDNMEKKNFTYICEDDTLDYERINEYMKLSPEEIDKAIKEKEKRWALLTEEEKRKECFNT